MTLVRIIKDWDQPNLLRQTPGGSGEWEGIRFTLDPVHECDYAVVLNRVPSDVDLVCPKEHVWAIIQEPPVPEYRWHQKGFRNFSRVYVTDHRLEGEGIVHSQPALPWHLDRDYDTLKRAARPDKTASLSWITSNDRGRPGQRQRMDFLRRITGAVEFDLWGKGFTPIDDKWDGLAPYRYSLAVENHSGPFYWTEKLADCFLAWTMPVYYGCTNIEDYFPKESMIRIDIHSPDCIEVINDVVRSDRWRTHRDAVAHARELVLDRHQFFPFVTNLIKQERANAGAAVRQNGSGAVIRLDGLPFLYPRPAGRRLADAVAGATSGLKRAGRRLLGRKPC
jgi:Glycosyltransferase family 10 (fucosyltransferase) C-term